MNTMHKYIEIMHNISFHEIGLILQSNVNLSFNTDCRRIDDEDRNILSIKIRLIGSITFDN